MAYVNVIQTIPHGSFRNNISFLFYIEMNSTKYSRNKHETKQTVHIRLVFMFKPIAILIFII